MPYIKFERNNEGNLVLPLRDDADFEPVTLNGNTPIVDMMRRSTYRREAMNQCQKACGNEACKTVVYVGYINDTERDSLLPETATLYCYGQKSCPLDEPPANDNEPLRPKPTPPTIDAQVEISI